jgi:hypothetical protein
MDDLIVSVVLMTGAVLILMVGGLMFLDLLLAYRVGDGPDVFGRRNRFFAWLLMVARANQNLGTPSKWLMWWRLVGTLGIGVLFLALGIMRAFGWP